MPCRVDLLMLCIHGFRSNENRTTAQNQRYCTRLLNNQRSEADCTTPETLPSVCKRLLKMTGYARVSTGDQDARLQHDALTAAGCYRIFTDTASGALQSRPELDKLLDQLRPGGTLVVWRLDRLGRSIRHLIDQLSELQDRGIEFRSLQENIDTSSPGGRLVFHIFASLAEFERDLIRERTNAGLAAARARGRVGGRPPSLTGDKLATAKNSTTNKT